MSTSALECGEFLLKTQALWYQTAVRGPANSMRYFTTLKEDIIFKWFSVLSFHAEIWAYALILFLNYLIQHSHSYLANKV